ncbi:uncharacterized protein LOC133196429 [Saccostrea echinata]|uniref:uncharacterized protein LOC133196429 n=1 Tax=Saccostrea echinata TaxID=191078 RepID=UPI002A7FBFBC|nr:uncharacterized protein LOC133196429 [Saccostrea echinata]XP_061188305.1 uncharacterized protein LOC133196429 [Saccostrea echinata]
MWTVIANIACIETITKKIRSKDRMKYSNGSVQSKRVNTDTFSLRNGGQLLPHKGSESWIFLRTYQWTKENEISRSFMRQVFFFYLCRKDSLSHYVAELGILHFFSIYQKVCGVSIEDNAAVLSWKTIAPYMYDTYHHADLLRCQTLTKRKLNVVKVCVTVEEHAVGHEFETNEGMVQLKAFSKLVRKMIPLPVCGEQLMCYVKGDVYLTGILKYFFIRQVFTDTGVVLGRSEYDDMHRRLESCRRLQEGFDVSVDDFSLKLAEAGYFLTNDIKLAQCFKCGGVLQLKQFDFDPWEDHAYWHPSCPFLLKARGQEFVDKVRLELKQRCDFNSECVFTFKLRNLAPVQPSRRLPAESESSDESDDYEEEDDDYFGSESPESDYFSDDEFY